MKNFIVAFVCLTLFIISCNKKAAAPPDPAPATTTASTTNPVGTTTGATVNTGSLKLYMDDSTKLNSITETGIQTTLINVNSFRAFSTSVNNTKLIYSNPNKIYMSDPNGSNQQLVYTLPVGYVNSIKAGLNNKIYYTSYQSNGYNFYSINTDGTANTLVFSPSDYVMDVTTDGNYVAYSGDAQTITIGKTINTGGQPTVNQTVSIPNTCSFGTPGFTYDSQKLIAPYRDGDTVKLKVFDINSNTAITKNVTVVSNYAVMSANVASDGDRVVIVVREQANVVCYIYRMSTNTVLNSFIINNFMDRIYAF